jgi:hypothetical protein
MFSLEGRLFLPHDFGHTILENGLDRESFVGSAHPVNYTDHKNYHSYICMMESENFIRRLDWTGCDIYIEAARKPIRFYGKV